MNRSYRIRVAGTGSYAPERIVTNEELSAGVDTSSHWIAENLGIRQRRVASVEQMTSDLAARAAANAIEAAGVDREEIGAIIVATATPDRKAPSTACLVKNKLGIRNSDPAFDVAAVCGGFMYALTVASHGIAVGAYDNVLVIGADTFSTITDWRRRDCVFFGDGAGAVLLQRSVDPTALLAVQVYSDTSDTDGFTVFPGDGAFTMNGRAVFETGMRVLPRAITSVLAQAGLHARDVTWVIPHQPSIRILRSVAESLEIPFAKVKTNMDRYANTAGATVPLLLDEVNRRGEIAKGDVIVLAAVGSGWTWGAAVMRWC